MKIVHDFFASHNAKAGDDALMLLCTLTGMNYVLFSQNLMAVMYRIVEGDQPRLPDHFNTQLRQLFLK